MSKQKLNFKELEQERDRLYISKQNPKRLKEIIEKLYSDLGIKKI